LILQEGNLMPEYNIYPMDIVYTVMKILDKGVDTLQEITQLEQKLLPHLFKSNLKMYYKATIRPENAPVPHNPDDPTSLVDEN